MALDTNLINAFAEQVTSAEDILDSGEYYNGTVKILDGKNYVQIDGSTTITPVAVSSVGLKDGNRVSCTIKDHRLSVIANMSDPSVNKTEVDEVKTKIIEVNTLIAEKVSTKDFEAKIADIEDLKADKATVEQLKTDMLTADKADIRYAKVDDLKATDAKIDNLKAGMITADDVAAKYATIESLKTTNETVTNLQGTYSTFEKTVTEELKAKQAAIDKLDADKLNANDADLKYATIKNLDVVKGSVDDLNVKQAKFETATADKFSATDASIKNLKADKLDATAADLKYANIDFANITEAAVKKIFSDSGIIKDLIVSEGKITGELVGVTIKGDLIEGGTVVADKLVVKGSNGLYYKLNTDGVTTEAEQTEYNSLNGSVITAKSITATKISVDDLVAFGATIAGYTIKDHALYSGAKSSAANTTRGVYMNDDGEFSVGDADNFIRFWKDADGKYKLAISAAAITMSTSGKSVESAINDAQSAANSANTAAEKANNDLAEFKSSYSQDMDGFKQTVEKTYATKSSVDQLQNIADAAIETWTGSGVPTSENLPTSKWNTPELKKQHSGDIYYDTDTGYSYRYGSSDGTTYSWSRIKDSDITSALNKADDVQTNLNNFKDTVSTTYVNKTTFEQTSESINSSVSEIKTDVGSLTTRLGTAETSIEQNKNDITLRATKTEVTSAIDNIQVGGRNILRLTNTKSLFVWATSQVAKPFYEVTHLDIDGARGLYASKLTFEKDGASWGVVGIKNNDGTLSKTILQLNAASLVLSFDVMINGYGRNLDNVQATVAESNGLNGFTRLVDPYIGSKWIENEWTHVVYIMRKTNDNFADADQQCNINIGPRNIVSGASITFKNVKLELGNKATDWSPAPEDLQPAGDYTTKAELKATSDSITASVSEVKTITDSNKSRLDNFRVGGRNLVLGTGVAKSLIGKGGTNETGAFYNLAKSVVGLGLYGNSVVETYEFSIDTEPTSGASLIGKFGENLYWDYCYSIPLTSDHVGVFTKVTKVTALDYDSSKDAEIICWRLDNYTGTVTIRNVKLEFGTTATDWSPAPEDLATTNDVEAAKTYSESQLKILSDNISTLVTDAAGKSMMKQTSSGWTFDMSKIQNGIDANANEIESVSGNLSNAEKTINDINENVKKLLDTSAYISIGQDDNGNPRLELGRKDSPFRVAISNTSIDFLEGTDKIAYISNKQLYIYSSVVTDELKIGDSTGYIWKRRANNHLGLRYVTS